MSKAWSLRYALVRAQLGWEETLNHLTTSTASIPDAIAKGMEAYRSELTKVILFTGAAMAPTLNAKAAVPPSSASPESSSSSSSSSSSTVDKLLMRCLPRPSLRAVFTGDVVAFNSPLAGPCAEHLMVRRVAAVEGEELITDDPADGSYTIPEGNCWVLADNVELKPPAVVDSRTFGPLPVKNIMGRVIYYARKNDHGPVENSRPAMSADAAVLEAELDLDKLQAS